jgi:hypothetical protein
VSGEELYGLPLDRFVKQRTALARSLRGEGRREEAAEVSALRKPSVAAWAVNQLIRTQRRAVGELFAAGDELRRAHEQVLAGGGGGEELRAAVERERVAVETLVSAARGLLSSEGQELSDAVVERVSETLHAAALDEDARRQVEGGRLVRELRHVGLGFMPAGRVASPTRRPPKRRTPSPADRAARQAARRRAERAARAVKEATEQRDRAAQALAHAEEELARALAAQREAQADGS